MRGSWEVEVAPGSLRGGQAARPDGSGKGKQLARGLIEGTVKVQCCTSSLIQGEQYSLYFSAIVLWIAH